MFNNIFSSTFSTKITIHRLVCSDSLEDNISRPALQAKVLSEMRECASNSSPANINSSEPAANANSEPKQHLLWRIKRRTLEDLFGCRFGDNGIIDEEVRDYFFIIFFRKLNIPF